MFNSTAGIELSADAVAKILQDFHIVRSLDVGSALIHTGTHPIAGDAMLVNTPEGNGALIFHCGNEALVEQFLHAGS